MARHNLSTVIAFEFTRTIKKRSFWAVTLILPILVFGLGALLISANVTSANTADQQKNARFDFLYVDASGLVDPAIAHSYGGKQIASSSEGVEEVQIGGTPAFFDYPTDPSKQAIKVYGADAGVFQNSKYSAVAQSLLSASVEEKLSSPVDVAILRGEFLLLLPKTNPAVVFLSGNVVAGLSVPVALMVATLAVTWLLLNLSTAGRVIYAMGDNFQAARLTGLPVRTTTILVYVFAALTALLAGLVMSAASGTVDFRTVTNGTLLFEVILVVVLGGIPLRGGRGGLRNIVVGVALIAVLRNGMTLLDFTTQTQDVIKGLVLVLAIVADNYLNPRDTETDTVGDL